MTPKQESDYGITKEFLNTAFNYKDGVLTRRTIKIGSGNKSVGWVDNKTGYARVQIGKHTWMYHRLVWIMINGCIPVGFTIDHLDHDPRNNKIENLRLATRSQQNKYQRKRTGCTTDYIGVYYRKRSEVYETTVNVYDGTGQKTSIYLGSYSEPLKGAIARDLYILDNNLLEFNLLNFPTGKSIRDDGKVVDGEFKPAV